MGETCLNTHQVLFGLVFLMGFTGHKKRWHFTCCKATRIQCHWWHRSNLSWGSMEIQSIEFSVVAVRNLRCFENHMVWNVNPKQYLRRLIGKGVDMVWRWDCSVAWFPFGVWNWSLGCRYGPQCGCKPHHCRMIPCSCQSLPINSYQTMPPVDAIDGVAVRQQYYRKMPIRKKWRRAIVRGTMVMCERTGQVGGMVAGVEVGKKNEANHSFKPPMDNTRMRFVLWGEINTTGNRHLRKERRGLLSGENSSLGHLGLRWKKKIPIVEGSEKIGIRRDGWDGFRRGKILRQDF